MGASEPRSGVLPPGSVVLAPADALALLAWMERQPGAAPSRVVALVQLLRRVAASGVSGSEPEIVAGRREQRAPSEQLVSAVEVGVKLDIGGRRVRQILQSEGIPKFPGPRGSVLLRASDVELVEKARRRTCA